MKALLLTALAATFTLPAMAQEFTGSLSSNDSKRENLAYYDSYEIQVKGLQKLQVNLNSDEFDTYLIVRTPSGVEYTNDDHEGENSYLEILTEESGTYTILASSYSPELTGQYSLVAELGPELKVSRTEGRLDPRDEQAPKGEYVDTHKITINTDQPFIVFLKCFSFDGFLVVTSPSGRIWRNDDFADDYNVSGITDIDPEKGEWMIQVTSVEAEAVGAYDIEVLTEN